MAKDRKEDPEFFPNGISKPVATEHRELPDIEWLKTQYKTKSAAIRYLHSLGHQPKTIAKHLNILYQHARNVCLKPLKRGPNEDWRPTKVEVKSKNENENETQQDYEGFDIEDNRYPVDYLGAPGSPDDQDN